MTTIEALQNLYEALGGEASAVENINTIPAMLSEISGQLSGSGGLPEVTAEDNGDVLGVVEGAWAKTEPVDKVAIYDVTISGDTANLDNQKTRIDIMNDLANDKIVFLRSNEHIFTVTDKNQTPTFISITVDSSVNPTKIQISVIRVSSDNYGAYVSFSINKS